jgi:hypothetical protein
VRNDRIGESISIECESVGKYWTVILKRLPQIQSHEGIFSERKTSWFTHLCEREQRGNAGRNFKNWHSTKVSPALIGDSIIGKPLLLNNTFTVLCHRTKVPLLVLFPILTLLNSLNTKSNFNFGIQLVKNTIVIIEKGDQRLQ